MNKNTIKKTIAGIVTATALTGGSIVIDNVNVTDTEIKTSIELAAEEGKTPMVDLSKVSMDRIAKGYIEVARDNNVILDSTATTDNVYDLIREKKKEAGEKVAPKSEELLLVK